MKNVDKENTNRETSQRRDLNTNKEPYGVSISLRQFSCNASVWNRMDQQQTGKGQVRKLVSPAVSDPPYMHTAPRASISWG